MADKELPVPPPGEVFEIDRIRVLGQPHDHWCGYTNLAMVMSYWEERARAGEVEIETRKPLLTPVDVFEHLHEVEYNPLLERAPIIYYSVEDRIERPSDTRRVSPTIDTMASIVRETTDMTTRIFDTEEYEKLNRARRQRGRSDVSPHDVLQQYIKNKIPVIVRHPGRGHFLTAIGYDSGTETYKFADTEFGGIIRTYKKSEWEKKWSQTDSSYPHDTRHLMLVVHPRKKDSPVNTASAPA